MRTLLAASLYSLGLSLQKHRGAIQAVQWSIVLFYLGLLVLPAFMPLPPSSAHIVDNLVLFAQFVFWGLWWPFVILSMLLFGRMWCGIFCPEGFLAEWTSRRAGLNRTIPRWLKWRGWPAVAFVLTTLYGQLISVYDYAQAALLVLGGSTAGAMLVGFLFGRGTRVWCRYLCPVSGVFNLLSRLAPMSFKTDQAAWRQYEGPAPANPQCAPMINIHQLNGVSACHMCGRCAGYRQAVQLAPRSCNEEILTFGAAKNNIWEMRLLVYGMIGVAIGAFTWTVNPWFVRFKLGLANWLVSHNIFWPLDTTAPWWLLTHYPANNDSFNWLDGFCITVYILGSGLVFGVFLTIMLGLAAALGGKQAPATSHLAQACLPLAAAGLFLGLTATTVKLLHYEGISLWWLGAVRASILAGAALWSLWLGARLLARYQISPRRRAAAFAVFSMSLVPVVLSWRLMFWGW